MTSIEAYILAKKIALGAVSGIKNVTLEGDLLVFEFLDGSSARMTIPLPKDGDPGEDGYSPTVSITPILDGTRITITDKDGAKSFEIKNGKDGEDGYSPTITLTSIDNGTKVTVTNKDGEHSFEVKNGKDGEPGKDGKSAYLIAIDNGFIGDEADWLDSLKSTVPGPKGDPFTYDDFTPDQLDALTGDKGDPGASIVDVKINASNHLICTLSDGTMKDAGELPVGVGGGLLLIDLISDLVPPGKDNIIYFVRENETLYYWDSQDNEYKVLTTKSEGESTPIDFETSSIIFDGSETTFDLPIDDKTINVYVNGIYLTEGEDYTIDRDVSPNLITFFETWEDADICTITWIVGTGGTGGADIHLSLATEEDIDAMFNNLPMFNLATNEDIDAMFDNLPTFDLATDKDIDNMFPNIQGGD